MLELGSEGAAGELAFHGTSMLPGIADGERVLDPPAPAGDILGKAVTRIAHGALKPLAPARGRALRSLRAGLLWKLLIKTRRMVSG